MTIGTLFKTERVNTKPATAKTAGVEEVQNDPIEKLKKEWGANNTNSNKDKKKNSIKNESLPSNIKEELLIQQREREEKEKINNTLLNDFGYPSEALRTLSINQKKAMFLAKTTYADFLAEKRAKMVEEINMTPEQLHNTNKIQASVRRTNEQAKAFEENKKSGKKIKTTEEKVDNLIGAMFPKLELIKQLPDEDVEEWREYYQGRLKNENISNEAKERYLKKLKVIREYKEFLNEVDTSKTITNKKGEKEILEILTSKIEAKRTEEREDRRKKGLLKDIKIKQ
ncbi:MAG: hypothetical protein NTW62_02155 [Candidatus Nomurabacteria bacterium]|nr:hypothetical protein [Candidatus Nomurabacteria bacterium]